ncbi:hypothetical protein TVAG_344550 [Trichomonas vaginalis G3]|uniref:Leucine Rich Repeat family protein n=1 Tax=Trichomonas vaginalis (strain ATCC PRA-98 / G3) TaxID=412133 RepID=A2FRG9_TRIV3|nr:outer arm dynein light chain 1 family [Trichomonas vaginalis G3]EAX92499.1 hypothetical protein TVAG_344550 [Trichomonas vaginalis G3]KAI5498301.1 outer arm dynein light chain 1 family [Trichomonas vaginalis G3]|eukprot:XP_001305429.1 hypothetical protein [Trichomonas vaginalis G3]
MDLTSPYKTRSNSKNEDNYKIYLSKGVLDLSGEENVDLSSIGKRPTLKVLNLSYTNVKSFEGLDLQPNIMQINLRNSKFTSLYNFLSVKNASNINVENTPFSRKENYMIQLVVAFGNQLRLINDKTIPKNILIKAQKYPKIVRELLDRGWEFIYPCPSDTELNSIADILGVSSKVSQASSSVRYERIIIQTTNSTQNPFTKRKLEILQRQTQMFEEYEKQLGIIDKSDDYTDRISDLLGCIGIHTTNHEDILNEVKKIISKSRKQKQNFIKSEVESNIANNETSKQTNLQTEEKINDIEPEYNKSSSEKEENLQEEENISENIDEYGSPIKIGEKGYEKTNLEVKQETNSSKQSTNSEKSEYSYYSSTKSAETSEGSAYFPPISSNSLDSESSANSWEVDRNYFQPIRELSASRSSIASESNSSSSRFGLISEPKSDSSVISTDSTHKKRKSVIPLSKHLVENKLYGYTSRNDAQRIDLEKTEKNRQKRKSSANYSPKSDKEFIYSYEYESLPNGKKKSKRVLSKKNQKSIPRVESVLSSDSYSKDSYISSPPQSSKMRFVSELDLEDSDDLVPPQEDIYESGTVEGDSEENILQKRIDFYSAEAYAGSGSLASLSIPEVESFGTMSSLI